MIEDALARGDVSSDHVDTLAKLTKDPNERDRSDLHAIIEDVIADAASSYVTEFERNTRAQIDAITAMNRPRDDEERASRQRAESKITSRVDRTTGMGTTVIQLDPGNLLPLCDGHHHQVHEGGWHLELQPDRTVTWFRPDRTTWWTGNSTNRRSRPGERSGGARHRPRPPDPCPDDDGAPQLTLC